MVFWKWLTAVLQEVTITNYRDRLAAAELDMTTLAKGLLNIGIDCQVMLSMLRQ